MTAVAVALALAAGTSPDPPDSVAYWLDEIVVTATRSARPIARIPVSVSAITAREIRSSNARSFADLLERLPGVSIQRTGEFGRSDPIIRGLGDNGKRLLVMVDGRPEKMALFGCTVTHTLPLGRVERVEVVRSALSHLYGSDAMGGVVNIVTAKPTSPVEVGIRSVYGTYATQIYQLNHGGARPGFSYLVMADHRSSDGHVDNSAYRGTDLGTRVEVEPRTDVSIKLGGKWFDGRKYEPPPRGQDGAWNNVWNDYTRYGADASADWSVGRVIVQAHAFYTGGEHRFSDGWHSTDRTLESRAELRRSLSGEGEVLVGLFAKHQWGERLGASPWDGGRSEAAGYVQAELPTGQTSRATLGLRYAGDSEGNAALAPALAAVWRASRRLSLRAATTTGFRFPQLTDLYLFPLSNPALDPERSLDIELGATARLGHATSLEGVIFQRELWDLIETVPYPGTPPSRYANEGRGTFRGFEATVRSRVRYWLEAALTYTNLDPGAATRGRVKNTAHLSILAGTVSRNLRLSVSQAWGAFAENDEREKLPDYLLIGAKGTVRLGWGAEAFVAVDNLLDRDYLVYAALPGSGAGAYEMPGRRFTAGIGLDYPLSED
jgi:vitamin B12 transporter